MKLTDLNAVSHFGAVVTLTHPDWTITGPLTLVAVEQDWIEEYAVGEEPRRVPGRRSFRVGVGPFAATIGDPSSVDVHLAGTIEVEITLTPGSVS